MSRTPPILMTAAVGLLLACHAFWGWVPILDSANLAFHEAGHPIFGLFSSRLMVYGGTLMQLLLPAPRVPGSTIAENSFTGFTPV